MGWESMAIKHTHGDKNHGCQCQSFSNLSRSVQLAARTYHQNPCGGAQNPCVYLLYGVSVSKETCSRSPALAHGQEEGARARVGERANEGERATLILALFNPSSSSLQPLFFITSTSLLHHFCLSSSSLQPLFLITSTSLHHFNLSSSSLLPLSLPRTVGHKHTSKTAWNGGS